jgi:hypothetical protein
MTPCRRVGSRACRNTHVIDERRVDGEARTQAAAGCRGTGSLVSCTTAQSGPVLAAQPRRARHAPLRSAPSATLEWSRTRQRCTNHPRWTSHWGGWRRARMCGRAHSSAVRCAGGRVSAGSTRRSWRLGPGDNRVCPETARYGELTCPRDLNTETGEISPVRGNHATRVTRTGRQAHLIRTDIRCLPRHLGCA